MAATGAAASLQEFIASLDKTNLPRILQVCSGVYFQGSVYELSGNEVCLSTGDIIKVVDIEVLSVSCEDVRSKDKFELPINYRGLLKLVPEQMPYSTVEEMVSLNSCLPFAFTSCCELSIESFTLSAGTLLTVVCVDERERHVRCRIQGQTGSLVEVQIPFSCRGEFCKYESDNLYTLQEIVSSPHLHSRRFCLSNSARSGPLFVSPIYQVHAIMDLRKNIVKFPSSLEVEVVDVTEQCMDVKFTSPLSLTEVMSQPDEAFPTMAQVLERPEALAQSLFKCSWLPEFRKGAQLVFHRKGKSAMILASSTKSRNARKYFLVSQHYNGLLRRRPREFTSVYELHAASIQGPGLKVSVMRHSDEVEEEGIPALSLGEQLEVLRCERVDLGSKGKKQSVEALVCRKLQELEEDDEDDDDDDGMEKVEGNEELILPLYMQGHFLEKMNDKKKYKINDFGKDFAFPLDVKVVRRDSEFESDPLASFPSLRLEEATIEPIIQASLPGSPQHCFEIPTRWLAMSVCFTCDPLPWPKGQSPESHLCTVTEVTDSFLCEFRKHSGSNEPPPPRPPKQRTTASSRSSKIAPSKSNPSKDLLCPPKKIGDLAKGLKNLALDEKQRPPPPLRPESSYDDQPPPIIPRKAKEEMKTAKTLPNTYTQFDKSKKKVISCDVKADMDHCHDYEVIDEDLVKLVKRAQEHIMF